MIILQLETAELQAIISTAVKKAILDTHLTNSAKVTGDLDGYENADGACQLLGIAKQTLYGLVSQRKLTSYKRAKKLYFKRSELLDWIQCGKRASSSELRLKALKFKQP